MRQFAIFLFVIGTGVTALSFLGVLTPVGDSLAVFRPTYAVAALILALWAWAAGWRMLRRASVVLSSVSALSVGWYFIPPAEISGPSISIYQKNMLFKLESWEALAADIRAQRPDVVTLQEVSERNAPILTALRDIYPTQHFCPFAGVGGIAVLSSLPPANAAPLCVGRDGLAAVNVVGPDGPLWIASLHLHWPWPYKQPAQAARLAQWFVGLDTPLVLGGDFNMVPWSYRLRSIAAQTGTKRAGPARISFWLEKGRRFYPMPIDHILAPGGGTLERRPLLGSDHYGVLARVRVRPN